MGLDRLKKHPKFDITSIVVLSPEDPCFEELQDLCVQYDHHITLHENRPLGKKKNHGLRAALTFDFDYLLDIDSDDVVSDRLLDIYADMIEEEKFIATTGYYIADQITNKFYRFNGFTQKTPHGIPIMHRSILCKDLWPDAMAGMDVGAQKTIYERHGIKPTPVDEFLFIDVKTTTNLHLTMQYPDLLTEIPPEALASLIPSCEYERIKSLVNKLK